MFSGGDMLQVAHSELFSSSWEKESGPEIYGPRSSSLCHREDHTPTAAFVRGGLHGNKARVVHFYQMQSTGATDLSSLQFEITSLCVD